MKAKNCSLDDLNKALEIINVKYQGNVETNYGFSCVGRQYQFTLRVKDSHKPGARIGQCTYTSSRGLQYRKHLVNACWHVHGDFFDALFSVNPQAVISASGRSVSVDDGNWVDRNIGSMMEPLMYSQACDCETTKYSKMGEDLKVVEVKTVHQNNLTSECWLVQFRGLKACEDCEVLDTSECGGKQIRKTLLNAKGLHVPIS